MRMIQTYGQSEHRDGSDVQRHSSALWSSLVCSTVARAFSERYVILHVNGLTCLRSSKPSGKSDNEMPRRAEDLAPDE